MNSLKFPSLTNKKTNISQGAWSNKSEEVLKPITEEQKELNRLAELQKKRDNATHVALINRALCAGSFDVFKDEYLLKMSAVLRSRFETMLTKKVNTLKKEIDECVEYGDEKAEEKLTAFLNRILYMQESLKRWKESPTTWKFTEPSNPDED